MQNQIGNGRRDDNKEGNTNQNDFYFFGSITGF